MSDILKIINIEKNFGSNSVLKNISLEIKQGEFFSLLGPSGCGKTTLLRILAGLEQADSGKIIFNGNDITNIPTQKRNIGIVFQNYALFPNMTVEENTAYGLTIRKQDKASIKEQVKEVLDKVRLGHKAGKSVNELSGGEQQRVSLARVIITKPGLILFDEPLSNLDYALRLEARTEIKRLQREEGITAIYVTHDQTEALSLSDRIAVMNKGNLMQAGTPAEIYYNPKNNFTAEFVGHYNIFLRSEFQNTFNISINEGNSFGILPEHITIEKEGECIVTEVLFGGYATEYEIECNGKKVKVISGGEVAFSQGDRVSLNVEKSNVKILNEQI